MREGNAGPETRGSCVAPADRTPKARGIRNGTSGPACRQVRAAQPEQRAAEELQEAILAFAVEQPEIFFLQGLGGLPRTRPKQRESGHQWPHTFMVRLSGRCNLACDYCFDSANCAPSSRLDRPTAERIADYILAVPVDRPLISFLGGEPLANWSVGRFLVNTVRRKARRLGKSPHFSIGTNGTLITDALAKDLVAPDLTVQISIDGLQDGHDRHRRYPDGAGSYQAALSGMRRLRAASKDARVDAQVVLTPGNSDLTAIAKELRTRGFRRISFLYLTAGANDSSPWSKSDLRELMLQRAKFYRYFVQSAIEGSPEVDMRFAAQISSQPKGPDGLCGCGRREIYIDAHGSVYPCPSLYGRADVPALGDCETLDASAPLPMPRVRPADEECARCWAFAWCGGGCAFQCQKCALLPSGRSDPMQKLWCDLMRAQFARASITHRFLYRFHPEALDRIRSLFADGG